MTLHFGGSTWHRDVWDMPHESWQWLMDAITARENAAKQKPRR